MNPQNESNTAGLATAAGLADPASDPTQAEQALGNIATAGHAPEAPQDGVPIAPPVDNDHVAPGAEQFGSAPAPTPQPEPEKPAPTEPPKVTPSPAPSPEPTPSPAAATADSSSATTDQTSGPATVDPPPTLIMPTVGRVVWYWPHGAATGDGEQPYAAHIVYVSDAHRVNLLTFSHDGFPMPRLGAHLVQPGEPAPAKGGYATWMPFQVGQARALQQPPAAS